MPTLFKLAWLILRKILVTLMMMWWILSSIKHQALEQSFKANFWVHNSSPCIITTKSSPCCVWSSGRGRRRGRRRRRHRCLWQWQWSQSWFIRLERWVVFSFWVFDHHLSLSPSLCQILSAHRHYYSHPCPNVSQNTIYSGWWEWRPSIICSD